MRSQLFSVLAALLIGVTVAGCDAKAGTPTAAQPSASLSREQTRDIANQWVACLREHGLTRMPDPSVSDLGRVTFSGTYNFKRDFQRHPDIVDACKSIIDRIPENKRRRGGDVTAADVQKLTQFAACVRSHGVAEFPDPDVHGVFQLGGTPLANERPQTRLEPAYDACKSVWDGDVKVDDGRRGGKK